jgi:uncharacterized protein (TIGR03437 family)
MKLSALFLLALNVGILPAAAQTPVLSAIENAASYEGCNGTTGTIQTTLGDISQYACTVSPGELVSIFGVGLAPSATGSQNAPSGMQIDSATGLVSKANNNVIVTFTGVDGTGWMAPLIYVSSEQINCVVPYEVVVSLNSPGIQYTTTDIQLWSSIDGYTFTKSSNVLTATVAETATGIFTANGTGSGQGAILNQDGSVNGPTNPEKTGNIISVFMTGAGLMAMPTVNPPGYPGAVSWGFGSDPASPAESMIDGEIVCFFGCPRGLANIPIPTIYPAYALVNGSASAQDSQPVVWDGSAPDLVEGVLQVNLVIPSDVTPGLNLLSILLGSYPNQSVTFAVR